MNTLELIFAHKEKCFPKAKNSLVEILKNAKTPQIIGEIKRGSPSKGHFAKDLDIQNAVARYSRLNVGAFSVLTDEKFFYGHIDDLKLVRHLTSKPILCKDFMVSPDQIAIAFASGANVILLIAKMLPEKRLKELLDFAHHLGIEVLMEIHDQEDYEKIRHLNFDILGINNRDLRHFKTDVTHSLRLYESLSLESLSQPVISESGYFNYQEIERAYACGFKGFLIGESLVKNDLKKPADIKMCGLKCTEDIERAKVAGADYIGFVLAESKRQVTEDLCKTLIDFTHEKANRISTVVVVKDVDERQINHYHKDLKADYIQVHGKLPKSELLETDIALIYATHISNLEGVQESLNHPNVKKILLDGSVPGSGRTFDWHKLDGTRNMNFSKPLWVAGGLTTENVCDLLKTYDIEGVDVSSGIELEGRKNFGLMCEFVEQVRRSNL